MAREQFPRVIFFVMQVIRLMVSPNVAMASADSKAAGALRVHSQRTIVNGQRN
jgi:hypothetical protein